LRPDQLLSGLGLGLGLGLIIIIIFSSTSILKLHVRGLQEVAQLVGILPNEAEVISSNPPPLSYVDMSKKKKKKKKEIACERPNKKRHLPFQIK
jgi:hypothetical protein